MKDINYVNNSIDNLKDFAKSKGLRVVFRNYTINQSDFCIFIYNNKKRGYLIGYDGYWDANYNESTSFDRCWDAAMNYIRKYNKEIIAYETYYKRY